MEGKVRRYAVVYDEAVAASTASEMAKCDRIVGGNGNNPHRHYTILQMEVGADGNIKDAAVSNGIHTGEVIEMVQKFSAQDVQFYLPKNLEARIQSTQSAKVVTLKRELSGGVPSYFVDICGAKDKKMIRALEQFDDSPEGYQMARRALSRVSGELNLPMVDFIAPAILTGKEV